MNFRILQESTASSLERIVAIFLQDGFELHGSLSVIVNKDGTHVYSQAVIFKPEVTR